MISPTSSAIVLTPTQRMAAAVGNAQAAIPEATNAKLLQAVLLEFAVDTLIADSAFAARVRSKYEGDVAASKKPPAGGRERGNRAVPKVSDYVEPLVPIKRVPNHEISLDASPDPYFLLDVYGAHQLERALKPRSLATLRESGAIVEQRHPGTMPKGRATKAGLIAYIMQYVAGAGATVPQA